MHRDPPVEYIGFWPRALAQLIDNALASILMLPGIALQGVHYFDPRRQKSFTEIMYGTVLPLTVLYLMWKFFQTSPGKKLVGARIVDADTLGRPSGGQLLLRMVGYVPCLLAFGLGFFAVMHDPRRQGWHDKLARTVVIRNQGEADRGFRLKTRPLTSVRRSTEPDRAP